jgi:hypothetical protein
VNRSSRRAAPMRACIGATIPYASTGFPTGIHRLRYLFAIHSSCMGGERASTRRQRETGKTCWKCRSTIPPPYPWRERLCGKCEAAVIHNVYVRFWREGQVWRVALSDMTGDSRMRDFTFASTDKIEALAHRGGALRDLAAKQAFETGIRYGKGGFQMALDDGQFAKVTLGRK